ncbi:hypothetical protein ACUSIJ_22475 [Pseudochelatococcus sp. B33]
MALSWKHQGAAQIIGAATKKTSGDENAAKKGEIVDQSVSRHATYMNVWLASAACCTCSR